MGKFLLFNLSMSLCVVGFFKFGELSYVNRSYFDSFDQNGIKYQVIQRQTDQKIFYMHLILYHINSLQYRNKIDVSFSSLCIAMKRQTHGIGVPGV